MPSKVMSEMATKLNSCSSCQLTDTPGAGREDLLVCHCFEVRESTIQSAVDAGANSVSEVIEACGAGGGCGACHARIERVHRGLPAKCGSGNFHLCGDCGTIGLLCVCKEETAVA